MDVSTWESDMVPSRDMAVSSVIDLDKVNIRLLALPADYEVPKLGAGYAKTQPSTPQDVSEKRYYESLVDDGGRPLYPVHLLDNVAGDPGAYQDMLRPWLVCHNANPAEWEVFRAQVFTWKHFRRWQAYNRRPGSPRHVDHEVAYNTFLRHFRRESPTYTEAAKNLLAKYDFTRPFQFHDDPAQQDTLTTWIEFLVFMYSFHDLYTRRTEISRPEYEKAWTTLVNTKVLRPYETEEYIRSSESATLRDGERARAYEAVKSAEATLTSVGLVRDCLEGSSWRRDDSDIDIHTRIAEYNLVTAKDWLASIEERSRLVEDFRLVSREYFHAKRDVELHGFRLRWVLEQVPLIEAEIKESTVPGIPHSTRGTKRGRDQENVDTPDRSVKRRRANIRQTKSSLGCNTGSGSQRTAPKSTRGNTADAASALKPSVGGGLTLVSHTNSPHRARKNVTRSKGPKTRAPDSESTMEKPKADPNSKAAKSASGRPTRRVNTKKAAQSAAISSPPRRSARIAAAAGGHKR
ncbi:hypothetical protein F5X97DRAFT_296927 [Nemania serpens]|nr:hypothetical protein F5X97DRAFT_296927 [Nemania serpens]